MTPRLYVAGPMSGLPDHNYPAFRAAIVALNGAGYPTLNPADVDHDEPIPNEQPSWDWYMRRTLRMLTFADAVALLDGWECSRGARLEVEVAHALGMTTLPVARWLEAAS